MAKKLGRTGALALAVATLTSAGIALASPASADTYYRAGYYATKAQCENRGKSGFGWGWYHWFCSTDYGHYPTPYSLWVVPLDDD